MATKAFQKIYTKISQITKATCSLKATEVGYDELAMVNGKLAQVVKIAGDEVTLQVFEGTEGIPTNAEVVFLGKSPTLKVSEQLAGRFFNALVPYLAIIFERTCFCSAINSLICFSLILVHLPYSFLVF